MWAGRETSARFWRSMHPTGVVARRLHMLVDAPRPLKCVVAHRTGFVDFPNVMSKFIMLACRSARSSRARVSMRARV